MSDNSFSIKPRGSLVQIPEQGFPSVDGDRKFAPNRPLQALGVSYLATQAQAKEHTAKSSVEAGKGPAVLTRAVQQLPVVQALPASRQAPINTYVAFVARSEQAGFLEEFVGVLVRTAGLSVPTATSAVFQAIEAVFGDQPTRRTQALMSEVFRALCKEQGAADLGVLSTAVAQSGVPGVVLSAWMASQSVRPPSAVRTEIMETLLSPSDKSDAWRKQALESFWRAAVDEVQWQFKSLIREQALAGMMSLDGPSRNEVSPVGRGEALLADLTQATIDFCAHLNRMTQAEIEPCVRRLVRQIELCRQTMADDSDETLFISAVRLADLVESLLTKAIESQATLDQLGSLVAGVRNGAFEAWPLERDGKKIRSQEGRAQLASLGLEKGIDRMCTVQSGAFKERLPQEWRSYLLKRAYFGDVRAAPVLVAAQPAKVDHDASSLLMDGTLRVTKVYGPGGDPSTVDKGLFILDEVGMREERSKAKVLKIAGGDPWTDPTPRTDDAVGMIPSSSSLGLLRTPGKLRQAISGVEAAFKRMTTSSDSSSASSSVSMLTTPLLEEGRSDADQLPPSASFVSASPMRQPTRTQTDVVAAGQGDQGSILAQPDADDIVFLE